MQDRDFYPRLENTSVESIIGRGRAQRRLPWIVAGAALLVAGMGIGAVSWMLLGPRFVPAATGPAVPAPLMQQPGTIHEPVPSLTSVRQQGSSAQPVPTGVPPTVSQPTSACPDKNDIQGVMTALGVTGGDARRWQHYTDHPDSRAWTYGYPTGGPQLSYSVQVGWRVDRAGGIDQSGSRGSTNMLTAYCFFFH
jgi:hypothetical protein